MTTDDYDGPTPVDGPTSHTLWHPAPAHGVWYALVGDALWELPMFTPRDGAEPSEPRRFDEHELDDVGEIRSFDRADYSRLGDEEIGYLLHDWPLIASALRSAGSLTDITLTPPPWTKPRRQAE